MCGISFSSIHSSLSHHLLPSDDDLDSCGFSRIAAVSVGTFRVSPFHDPISVVYVPKEHFARNTVSLT